MLAEEKYTNRRGKLGGLIGGGPQITKYIRFPVPSTTLSSGEHTANFCTL
jgi:hypothetical protein